MDGACCPVLRRVLPRVSPQLGIDPERPCRWGKGGLSPAGSRGRIRSLKFETSTTTFPRSCEREARELRAWPTATAGCGSEHLGQGCLLARAGAGASVRVDADSR